jgi:D-alanyl-D-alanine carboxypeptidase
MRVVVLIVLALFLRTSRHQQSEANAGGSQEIKRLLEVQRQAQHLVGIAAIVIRSETIIGIAASGVKREGAEVPVDSADMWHLGSNTKAITATMIARLVEEGQLRWTVTPLEIFPELKRTMHPAYRKVTIEQLLSHHAGIPPAAGPEAWPHLSGNTVEQRSKFAASVLSHAPATKLGTKGLYSNAGYVIAAAMAERRTGLSWEDLVTAQVLEPLGMHAIFGFPLSVERNQPWGHIETRKGFEPVSGGAVELPSYLLPAGGMAMTPDNYAKFLQMNLRGLEGKKDKFLSTQTIRRLHSTAIQDEYALGWGLTTIDGVLSSTHAGSAGSFYAVAALQSSRDEAVAVFLNTGGDRSSAAGYAVLEDLLKRYAAPGQ